ncbi:hypothetical protein V0U79_10790 [Hyphobacterium sp. HN65]|uniref:Tail specific protease domain-containing protein n=1 Tax=Hyphobacterium lacteum TaxID=3116575 RepID=A0ABU7LSI0_9PROT|nr:hypothetical protein [Hyphobacterium sp. HN65]MEE2526858.1 hypothetical protein [Hyphobacterium sp. HN65]
MTKTGTGVVVGVLLAGLLTTTGPTHAQGFARPQALSSEQWEADLDAFLTVLLAEHDDPYFHTPQSDFDAAVGQYRGALPNLTRAQRIAGLAQIAALVGDGHTWMPMHALPFEGLPPGPGFRSLPVRFDIFHEGLFVVGAVDPDLVGARVAAFGNVAAEEAVARALTLLPTDAVNFAREMLPEWLMQAELLAALGLSESPTLVRLSIEQDGREREIELTPLSIGTRYDWIYSYDGGPISGDSWTTAAQEAPLWRESFEGAYRAEQLDGAVYLQIIQIRDDDVSYADIAAVAVAMAEAMDSPALVIDLRRCLGGDGTLNAGLMSALTESGALMETGRLAVLTSRQTHSAAVMLVSDLEQQTPARFYGQATADRPNHHGETNLFVTPNSQLPIIHASEYYQTSFEGDDRRFRSPDVAIPYRFSDYSSGTDPVLDAALSDFTE